MVDSNKLKQLKGYEARLKAAQNLYDTKEYFRVRSDYYDAYINTTVNEKMIMYEAFHGRAITCNPGAIFRHILDDERFMDYEHIWVLEESDFREAVIEEFIDRKNVKFIYPNTNDYYYYLSTAKYLINNSTWPNYFTRKDEQVVINTWHGIPLKELGYDMQNGIVNSGNVMRNFLSTDFIVSPVTYTTEMFKKSYKLDGIYDGKFIEAGYPRIDRTINVDRHNAQEELRRYNINYDPNKKIILYAPTWRGDKYAESSIDMHVIDEYDNFVTVLEKSVDMDQYQIFVKPHEIVYAAIQRNGVWHNNYIPSVIDTNNLLGITDILISDYSSIFFDFLVTKRPILFYITDLEAYSQDRGLYFSVDNLPGPITDNLEQLSEWINNIDNFSSFFEYKKYEQSTQKFSYNETGHSCEDFVNAVFYANDEKTKRLENHKKKLLIHLDVIRSNGVSTAAQNLLANLDYEKYDVTFYTSPSSEQTQKEYVREFLANICDKSRTLVRTGARISNVETFALAEACLDNAITYEELPDVFPIEFYRNEYKRCFGKIDFDYIVEFSGYSVFFACLYLSQKNPKKLIWLHSVMEQEYRRVDNGRHVFKRSFDSLYKLYKFFDACVSVTKKTMQVNMSDFAAKGIKANHLWARNVFISKDEVQAKLSAYKKIKLGEVEYLIATCDEGKSLVELVRWPQKSKTTFITVGRLADAKNTLSLVKAFSMLRKDYRNIELYLVGAGALENDIRKVIEEEKMHDDVIMTGTLANPYPFLGAADCFVFPSRYESQGIAIQEARAVNLPIIVSNFATVEDSTFENGQLVIGMEVEDIYEGMKKFMLGQVPCDYDFDIEEYNRKAMEEFEYCLTACDSKTDND